MAKYVDICIQPVPKKSLANYRKITKTVGKLLLKHGALASRDFVADDLNATKASFPKSIKVKPSEVLVYAVAEFKSRAHRDKVFKLMSKDLEMGKIDFESVAIDMKRVVIGGFSLLVEVE